MITGDMTVLVGDLGGTHTRLAIAAARGGEIHLQAKASFLNREAGDLEEIIRRFLASNAAPLDVCLAIAGPIEGPIARLTNLDWCIDTDRLERAFGFRSVTLINDFEAVARGIDHVPRSARVVLQANTPLSRAPRLAVGPGTGFGVAQSIWSGDRYLPLSSEGGHIGFAPVDAEQSALLDFLRAKYGRVSVERILSGPGIIDLHAFCALAAGRPARSDWQPADISAAALNAGDPLAKQALRLFTRILGQTVGDLALVALARGGVFIAGGIPGKILTMLGNQDFLDGFTAKGRFGDWTKKLPVWVLTDPDIGLRGAAEAGLTARC